MLLRDCPLDSLDDGYKFENIRYATYQQACHARGMLSSDSEARDCFTEALIDSSPPQLRFLFVLMTLQGYPTINVFYDYEEQLKADLQNTNELLRLLDDHFTRENKDMADYGLPK